MPYNTKNITVQTRKATLASDNLTEEQAFITIWGIIKPFSVCIILVWFIHCFTLSEPQPGARFNKEVQPTLSLNSELLWVFGYRTAELS